MRQLYFILFALTSFLIVAGFQCGECEEYVCVEPLAVRFLSEADGSDVFANGTYNIADLYVFSMWADSTMALQQSYIWPLEQDSDEKVIHFDLYEIAGPVVAYVFQFNNQEQDTLQVRYVKEADECCGEVLDFMFGIYKGDTIYPDGIGYLILKK
jgi:hypothetical protein